MGIRTSAAMLAIAMQLTGCFGYSRSAKGWAYVGDAVLLAGGGAAIALEHASGSTCSTGDMCPTYTSPVAGGYVAGAALVTAGLVGLILNATRPSSRPASLGRGVGEGSVRSVRVGERPLTPSRSAHRSRRDAQ